MRRYSVPHIGITLLTIWLLTGCSWLGLGRATPTPVAADSAIESFLTSAPVPIRMPETPTPEGSAVPPLPRGLPLPLVDPLNVVGDIEITGSPALAPLTRLLYDRFVNDGYRDTMTIEEVGANAGFERYCTHEPNDERAADIVMADRPITQRELQLCLENNRRPVALRVAQDVVVVVSHVENDFLTAVHTDELAALFTARRWSDVRRAWPATEIVRVIPPVTESMTALFVEKILRYNTLALQNAPATTFLEDGAEIAIEIADTPAALGLLKYADFQENATALRLIAINGIRPNSQVIADGNYLLTYPLLLYTDLETLEAKGRVGAFLMYYLTYMNNLMVDAGNFSVSEAVYERTKVVLLTAMGQGAYLEQFPPTSTPEPPTPTPTITPTVAITATVVLTPTLDVATGTD